jgi:hypothetical protein
MGTAANLPGKFGFDKGYNCFCSPVGVLLKLNSFPYVNSVLYSRWDFFYDGKTAEFPNYIQRLYKSTQQSVKKNLYKLYGAQLKKHVEKDDAMALLFLKRSLDQNTPLIVTLDLYFLPYLPFSERKFHNTHFLIVTGYDSDSNHAFIIDSFAGYQGNLSLDILCRARQSRLCGCSIQNCCYEFKTTHHTKNTTHDQLMDLLVDCGRNLNLWKSDEDSTNGIGAITAFAHNIRSQEKGSLFKQPGIAEYIRDIEWQRKGFVTFIKEIEPIFAISESVYNDLKVISKEWTRLRRLFYFAQFRHNFRPIGIYDVVQALVEKEVQFISKMLKYLPE